ncbi:DUF2975 domain-containing protein [Bifidobacterium sp. 82T24]|uniref:DUF2975 domain-containing protein n=1 Tax=Bifidobacterium pluvialisilvae TaxID=2834436 RepID=UPI001C55C8F4|nr:DUF2975 domain-containing protein [Bifidobacterium pluvialisilvae]MBW3087785.1 DUF2975 domain-containing protein [Bifidobacterium pluvialisilvae]
MAALKVLLALIEVGALACQAVLLPVLAAECAADDPAHAYLRVPYLALSIAIIACFEAAVVAVWRLLSMTGAGVVFSRAAFLWVDAIIWCAVLAALLTLALLVHAAFIAGVGPLGLLGALFAALLGETAAALLMVVMRGLLGKATDQREELEAVI